MKNNKKELIKGVILSTIFVVVICGIFIFFGEKNKNIETRTISNVISIAKPNDVDYSRLNSDNNEKTTFGKDNLYSISCSIEDGYAKAIKEYGSIEKAEKKLKIEKENEIEFDYGLDGYLFTYYLLSYLGGISKNVGIPAQEEIVTLNNGVWLHYYNFPTKENGDKFETYITWNDGIFYFVEIAYQNEFPQDGFQSISNASFLNEKTCFIPYEPSLNDGRIYIEKGQNH